jgi:hypothetical protein
VSEPEGRGAAWTEERAQLLGLVARRGACHLPDGTAAFVASSLRTFEAERRRHSSSGPCPRVPAQARAPGARARREGQVSPELRVNPIACEAHGYVSSCCPS